jgi:integrase
MMRSQVRAATFDSYRRILSLHALPHLGDLPLKEITPLRLTRLYADLLESGKCNGHGGLAAQTVRYIANTIHKVLADAVDTEVMAANPASRAKAPRPSRIAPVDLRFWTPEQLRQFLLFTQGLPLAVPWRLAALTGLRRGEVLGLRWADVDFDTARLAVRHTVISIASRVTESTPKSHQARVVDLDAETVRQLRSHRDRQRSGRSVAPGGGDLVFCREDGTPIHPETFSRVFNRLVARAALPRIRLHDLRHTHATIALRAGVPVKVISERLGHSAPSFTMRVYAHVIPGMQAEAAAQIAGLVDLGPAQASPS